MRKAYMTISALLLCTGMMLAQTPANRTAKTVAADVLAQMPAGQQETYNDLIGQLSQAGDDAVQVIVGMINAPGKGSNAQTDYALSGLSHFVMAKGQESARLVVAKAYVKALGSVSERETKAFIIRQLQIMGGRLFDRQGIERPGFTCFGSDSNSGCGRSIDGWFEIPCGNGSKG